jgi:hypothetical protein
MNNFISTTRNCHSHIHESTHFILLDLLKVHVYPLFFSSFALDLSVVLQATKYFLLLHASTLKNPTQRVGLEQSGFYHHLIEN